MMMQKKERQEVSRRNTVDSLFAPIEKVSYVVENTRVGQATNFDKITFHITTDASVSPKEAMIDAARICGQFSLIAGDREPTKSKRKKLVDHEER